jgi:hypothetical protein
MALQDESILYKMSILKRKYKKKLSCWDLIQVSYILRLRKLILAYCVSLVSGSVFTLGRHSDDWLYPRQHSF